VGPAGPEVRNVGGPWAAALERGTPGL
jgi:hypothetical protein